MKKKDERVAREGGPAEGTEKTVISPVPPKPKAVISKGEPTRIYGKGPQPTRRVCISTDKFDVYIGRAMSHPLVEGELGTFGNPYINSQVVRPGYDGFKVPMMGIMVESRDDSIRLFETYMLGRARKDPEWRAALLGLKGKVLGCWCPANVPCHGDKILEWLKGELK